jgi:hypothetical protein
MAIGLLKAYLSKEETAGINARVSLKYDHYPDRLGVTLAFGKISDEMAAMAGHLILVTPHSFYLNDQAAGLAVRLSRGICPPYAPHITLGWNEGYAPVVAGEMADRVLRGAYSEEPPLLVGPFGWMQMGCTIEFKSFED